MRERGPSPLNIVDATFHSMEEANEVNRAAGWDCEFRQLGKGRVNARYRALQLGRYTLYSQILDKRVHFRGTPPTGCVVVGIVPTSASISYEGAEFGRNKTLLVDQNSESEIVTPPGDAGVEALILPRSDYEASARALFRRSRADAELTGLFRCAPSAWSALRDEVQGLLRNDSVSREDLSRLLGRFLDLRMGESEECQGNAHLGNGSARRVARRAQEYVEDNYRDTIRMEDLCDCAGVTLRTLQRSFSGHFQVSLREYIKARRLNAARQALVCADPSHQCVTRIALDSGFTHLGRFSVEYREHFGESPRETLGRRRWVGRSGQWVG